MSYLTLCARVFPPAGLCTLDSKLSDLHDASSSAGQGHGDGGRHFILPARRERDLSCPDVAGSAVPACCQLCESPPALYCRLSFYHGKMCAHLIDDVDSKKVYWPLEVWGCWSLSNFVQLVIQRCRDERTMRTLRQSVNRLSGTNTGQILVLFVVVFWGKPLSVSPCRFLCVTTGSPSSETAPTTGWWRRCRLNSRPFLMTSQSATASWSCLILTCVQGTSRTASPFKLIRFTSEHYPTKPREINSFHEMTIQYEQMSVIIIDLNVNI